MRKIELKNRGVILALSITISILLWSYVMGDINPRIDRNFSSVAIEVIGNETGDFILSTEDDLSVDVNISGRRNDIYRIRRDDMNFTLDISGYGEGTHIIPVEHSIKMDSSDIDLSYSPREVEVTLDSIVAKDFSVDLNISEGFLSEIPRERIKAEEKTVTISGGRSLVERVDRLVATLDTTDIISEGSIELDIKAIDSQGNVVEGLELNENTLSLTILPESSKIMDIEADISGEVSQGYRIASTELSPSSIEVSGEADGINTISTEPIDISGIEEDTEYQVGIILPEGVESDFDGTVTVKIGVEPIQDNNGEEDNGEEVERTITYSVSDISLLDLGEDLNASFQNEGQEISIVVSANKEYIEDFDREQIELTIDLSDIREAGTYDMDIGVSDNSESIGVLSVEPKTLGLIISEK